MKISCVIPAFLCVLAGASASLSTPKSHLATTTALSLRGGDHISNVFTPDRMTKFATAYFMLHGSFGAADAAKYWEPFGLNIQPNTLAAWCGENNGFTPMGMAVMSYLALTTTSMSPVEIVATAAMLCCFFMFKSCYSDTFKKLGFTEGFGTFVTLSILVPIYMALTGKGDPDIVAGFLWVPPLVWGVSGMLSPEMSLKPFGLKGFATVTDKLIWKFQCLALVMWGVQAYTLMNGGTAFEAMRNAVTAWCLSVVDVRFLRPSIWRDAGFTEAGANVWTIFVTLLTALFYAK